jgi:hypothetical protein
MSPSSVRVGLLLLLGACGKDSAPEPPAATPALQPVAAAPSQVVEIYVDDKVAARVALATVVQWPRLDTLVPVQARRLGTWDNVSVQGRGAQPTELHRIADQHPDLVPALYPLDDHTAAFGLFDPVELAKHGKAQIHEDGVSQIHIKLAQGSGRGEHEQGEGGGTDPSQLSVSIVTSAGKFQLDGKTLLAIPRVPLPGETGDGRGWALATLLEAAKVTKFERLVLSDAAGLNLTLDKKDFDPQSSIPYVKLNRQGALRFNLFKKVGTGWQRSGDLRGLVSIQVAK